MPQPSGLLVQSTACRIGNLTTIGCVRAVTRSNPCRYGTTYEVLSGLLMA